MKPKNKLRALLLLTAMAVLGGCSYETEPMNPSMRLGIGFSAADQTARWQWEQGAEQFTLLEITAPGSETRVRLVSNTGETLSQSRLPHLRSAPFFVCAESDDEPVTFDLELQSIHRLGDQAAIIKFYRVPEDSYADRERAHGLRKLCAGQAEQEAGNADAWTVNLQNMEAAERALSSTGEAERAHWAAYFAAYFRYAQLDLFPEAIEAADALSSAAESFPKSALKLLALQLKGQASLESKTDDPMEHSRQLSKIAIPSFQAAVRLARASGNRFEEAWALNNWGTALYAQNNPKESRAKYSQALEIIESDPERYLEDMFRSNLLRE